MRSRKTISNKAGILRPAIVAVTRLNDLGPLITTVCGTENSAAEIRGSSVIWIAGPRKDNWSCSGRNGLDADGTDAEGR